MHESMLTPTQGQGEDLIETSFQILPNSPDPGEVVHQSSLQMLLPFGASLT